MAECAKSCCFAEVRINQQKKRPTVCSWKYFFKREIFFITVNNFYSLTWYFTVPKFHESNRCVNVCKWRRGSSLWANVWGKLGWGMSRSAGCERRTACSKEQRGVDTRVQAHYWIASNEFDRYVEESDANYLNTMYVKHQVCYQWYVQFLHLLHTWLYTYTFLSWHV